MSESSAADDDNQPQFQVLPAPDDEEVQRLAASLAERITKLLLRRGLGPTVILKSPTRFRCLFLFRYFGLLI